jgi:dihydropyrimidine dehydrogenase (NAD+) subunit PreA
MADLTTRFLGMTFPNPFLLASSPLTVNSSVIIEGIKAGWGGAILKTIGLEPTPNPSPALYILKDGRYKRGMINLELITEFPIENWLPEIYRIREAFPDRPIIASIMGGGKPESWQKVINIIEPGGISAYEMNVSCPNFSEKRGAQLGQDPEALYQAVSWVRNATSLPVIVKLTPNVTDIVALARVALEAGADAITATNTLSGLAGVDLESLLPLPTVDHFSAFGGYSGPALKPVSLRCAANIAQNLNPPLIGSGGIAKWQDAAEYMALGASLVEVCTAVMWRGYGIIDKFTEGLSQYLDSHQLASPTELVGKALPHLVKYSKLNLNAKKLASVAEEDCNGCGECILACAAGAAGAIELVQKKAFIDIYRCKGCGLCVGICPRNAINLNEKV